MKRLYYSQRNNLTKDKIDFETLKKAFGIILTQINHKRYLQEYFGHSCNVYRDYVFGKAAPDIESYIFIKTRRTVNWPLENNLEMLHEDTLFDMIEFIYDHISEPINDITDPMGDFVCCTDRFESKPAQVEYIREINNFLKFYNDGYEMNQSGEITAAPKTGFEELVKRTISQNVDEKKVKRKINKAIEEFHNRHSNFENKKDAVRELIDVLEYFQKTEKIENIIYKKDEKDLFKIANNFSIRHNNQIQQNDYGIEYLNWMFYEYLAVVHLCIDIENKNAQQTSKI